MPRKARIVIPGVAHHVVQRGHNRQVVFTADEDFQFYIENLTELKGELDVRLYAYCLMTNHVHLLLMSPGGHLKVLHLWPGQIPPPLRRRDMWTLGGLCAFGKAGG